MRKAGSDLRLALLIALAAGSLVATAAQPLRPGTGLVPRIHDFLRDNYPPGEPGAAVVVARDGRPFFRRAYGLADAEFGVMLEPDMVFRIGSVTKQFTAALILRMAEAGRLSLSDPVSRYLPDAPAAWRAITIEHLLSHTAGLPNYTAQPGYVARVHEKLSVEELLDLFRHLPLEFEPGTRFSYSNSGYAVAGAIVERVAGRPFAEALREELLVPLALHQTFYDDPERILPRRARGYVERGGVLLNAPYISITHAYAAGALASTLDDLVAWDAALTSGRALRTESLARMFSPVRLADGTLTQYGLGWALSEYDGHSIAEHGGGIPGFRSHVIRVPDERLYVAVLSNLDRPGADPSSIARRMAALALGSAGDDPPPLELPETALAPYEGTYRGADGTLSQLALRRRSVLALSRQGRPLGEFYAFAPDRFAQRGGVFRLEFRRDRDGRITGFECSGWGRPWSADRQ